MPRHQCVGRDKGINLIEHSTAQALDLLSQTPTLIIGETQTSLTSLSNVIFYPPVIQGGWGIFDAHKWGFLHAP